MYHHSNHCAFDLWSSVVDDCAVENRAFSAYAFHTSEIENIIDKICAGETEITISSSLSQNDLDYIKKEVERRMNQELDK